MHCATLAGLLKLVEAREEKQGITPDPHLAQLMAGLHSPDATTNVALTLQLLALVECADTIVGDGMVRGISGGERKRVTSGEVMVGPSKVLFMDEISTGSRSRTSSSLFPVE
jgi:ABC-type glutathione transport system ATPase component